MRQLIFILCFFSFGVISQDFFSEDRPSFVEVTGEVLLASSMTMDDAYKAAESLAKIKASKTIGEYLQVITVFDEKTGKRNEAIATVTASVLKYEVLSKEITPDGEDFIASVTIRADVSEADLDKAITRFFEEESYRKEALKAHERVKELETMVQELSLNRSEIETLDSNVASNSTPMEVRIAAKRQVYKTRQERDELARRQIYTLANYDKQLQGVISLPKGGMSVDIKKKIETIEVRTDAERSEIEQYKKELTAYLNKVRLQPSAEVAKTNTGEYVLRTFYNVDPMFDSSEFSNAFKKHALGDLKSANGLKNPFVDHAILPVNATAARIAVYLKFTVNGESRAIPVIYPIERKGAQNCYTDRVPHVVHPKNRFLMCFAHGQIGRSSFHAPGYLNLEDYTVFKVDSSMNKDSVSVEAVFEIREIL